MQLANFYVNFGKYYGIRGDIAFAQAILETDYFRFITEVVQPHQNNYCGLGSTKQTNPGASFDTPQDGVLAHLQHLFAYAETKPLPEKYPLWDPRFQLVGRGDFQQHEGRIKWEMGCAREPIWTNHFQICTRKKIVNLILNIVVLKKLANPKKFPFDPIALRIN